VLFLETSEELPSGEEVFRILRNMGERGLLQRFSALLMGRAKTWSFERPNSPQEGARYAAEQREAVQLRAMRAYAPDTTIVFDVDSRAHGSRRSSSPTGVGYAWTVPTGASR
jgi:hypothetical protein